MIHYNERLTIFVTILLAANGALASPYFYFAEDVLNAPQQVVSDGAQKVAEQAAALPQRIQGHVGELLSHGGSAIKSVANSMSPDLQNIGQDLSEVYKVTRDNVNSRMVEPLSSVRPYINKAQEVVAPLVNQAKEEVPKLIEQAGPALQKVGTQVRDGMSSVWNKISSATSGTGNAAQQAVQEGAGQVAAAGQQAIENGQYSATNAIQQGATAAQQAVQQQ